MKNKTRYFTILAFFATLSTLILTSCGTPKETPEQVMAKFKVAMSQIDSAAIAGEVGIAGAQENSEIKATLSFQSKFDYRKADEPKSMAELGLKGKVQLPEGNKVAGDLALAFTTLGDNFYLKLDKLDSDDESVQKLKPILGAYMGKWLHLPSDLVPENIRQLQKKQAEHRDAVKKIIADSSFFRVTKEYGTEIMNGRQAYHYGVTVDHDGVREYIRRVSLVNGRELTVKELDEAVKVLDTVSEAEVWIGTEDYHLNKAKMTLDGKAMEAKDGTKKSTLLFSLELNGSDYNKDMAIAVPEGSEEFNPFALLMGLSAAQGQAPAVNMGTPADESNLVPPLPPAAPTAPSPAPKK